MTYKIKADRLQLIKSAAKKLQRERHDIFDYLASSDRQQFMAQEEVDGYSHYQSKVKDLDRYPACEDGPWTA
jgi:hypothetical protein